jgi:hypothetical protein
MPKNRLSVVLSGRKQSGKNATCNYILAKYLNRKGGGTASELGEKSYWKIDEKGNLHHVNLRGKWEKLDDRVYKYGAGPMEFKLEDHSQSFEILPPDKFASSSGSGAKIYSFADPLKQFCINVFGASHEQMYGTDAQKNSVIEHLLWENLSDEMRMAKGVLRSGVMTGRELMQIFGTEMVRRLYADAWARATYSAIANEGQELAMICDGRFPNEIEMGTTVKAKTIRLLRAVYTEDAHASETALDNYPLDKFTVVVDNREMTLEEQCKFLDPYIEEWFNEAGIR